MATDQTLSGPRQTQLLNLRGKVRSFAPTKTVSVAGRQREVSSLELVDGTHSLVEVHVWGEANRLVQEVNVGDGITIVGCSAQLDPTTSKVKLNLWESGHVLLGGPMPETLSDLDMGQEEEFTKLTATYTPSGPLLSEASPGFPTCAAALANVPRLQGDRVVQVNRCTIDLPTRQDQIFTQDGTRLYCTARLRDWSGAVDVDLVTEPILELFGCRSIEDLRAALDANSLRSKVVRVNARGVIRSTDNGVKLIIGMVREAPLDAVVSRGALLNMLGLSELTGALVLPVPAGRVEDKSGATLPVTTLPVTSSGT